MRQTKRQKTRHIYTDRETEGQTDRQADRQAKTQHGRQSQADSYIHTYKVTYIQKDTQTTNIQTETQGNKA